MDRFTHAPSPPALSGLLTRRLLRRLYTSNPFYVISADLVFVGLRMSFDTGGTTFETGALMVALLGYTLLLATTACLLIRLGSVWDDARTILLLVVAMFLAISVTFDETLARSPRFGVGLYVGGLAFAVAVSEGLLRGIRLRLPPLFRVPYYLILSLFFLYPVALSPWLRDPESPVLRGLLFGFSAVAGLAFLSLIPAVRRGPGYVAKNGSPWRYPLYPWVLFGLLAMAVCGRSSYLCLSLHFPSRSDVIGRSDSIFGPYFLVPFLLALDALVLEAGIVARSRGTQRAAVLALPGLVILAMTGHRDDPVYRGFLDLFVVGLGSPLFLTLIASAAFCAYAAIRRAPSALGGLTCALLALSVVDPRTLDLDGLVAPRPTPLLLVAALQVGLGVWRREAGRCVAATVCLVVAVLAGAGGIWPRALVAYHLALAAAMLIGAAFDDPLARRLRGAGAVMLGFSCLVAAWDDPGRVPPEVFRAYLWLGIVVAVGYGYLMGCRAYLIAALVALGGWSSAVGWEGYAALRRAVVGLNWIVGGMAFFAVAAAISLGKTGLLARWTGSRAGDTDRAVPWVDGRWQDSRFQIFSDFWKPEPSLARSRVTY